MELRTKFQFLSNSRNRKTHHVHHVVMKTATTIFCPICILVVIFNVFLLRHIATFESEGKDEKEYFY